MRSNSTCLTGERCLYVVAAGAEHKVVGHCELCLAKQQLVARLSVLPEANYKEDRITLVTVWIYEDTQERK
jgi:hypothetical protein